jgi:pantothenate kinase
MADAPRLLEDPISQLFALLDTDTPRRLIGLVGIPGSGKSTLAATMAKKVNANNPPDTMLALSMDGFHLTRAQLDQLPDPKAAHDRRGAPWTFDPKALASRLHALREAAGIAPVTWPDFQHDIGDPVEGKFVVPPTTRLVLVEGLYLLHQDDGWADVRDSFDECWYLNTPMDVAMERLVARHMSAWHWSREAAENRVAANDRLNAELVLQSRFRADFLLTDKL